MACAAAGAAVIVYTRLGSGRSGASAMRVGLAACVEQVVGCCDGNHESGGGYLVGWPPISWWTWARWPSRSKIMMSSAGPSMAAMACGRHGGELGGFAGLDGDLAFAERQAHPPLDDEEPVVAGMDALLRRRAGRFESHLDGDRAAGWAAQHPGRALTGAVRRRADDHVVVAAHVEERVEVDLQGRCQRHEDVEADRPLACLDAADGGRD